MDPAVDPEAEAGHAPSQEGAPQTGVTSVAVADAAGASQTGQASSQSSSFLSGPSCAAGDEEQMDSSVCRKRKDRPLAELSCSVSCEEMISSSKKVLSLRLLCRGGIVAYQRRSGSVRQSKSAPHQSVHRPYRFALGSGLLKGEFFCLLFILFHYFQVYHCKC